MPAIYHEDDNPLPVVIAANFTMSCVGVCADPIAAAIDRYSAIISFGGPADPSKAAQAVPKRTSGLPKTVTGRSHGRRQRKVPEPRYGSHSSDDDDPSPASRYTQLSSLVLTVASSMPLSPQADESYTLTVPSTGAPAQLQAATQWGALRGLESFAQLVIWQGPDDQYTYLITNTPLHVHDYPRFQYRGVLIDTSFNFLTVDRVKDVIDSMPVMKANVLHWHLFDDPAWSAESTNYPACTGPLGPYASTAYYTIQQQEDIAQYAWERGVMILVEFDVPGHSSSWAACNASLVTACEGHQTLINPVGEPGQAGTIYEVLATLMAEFQGRVGTPGLPWVHLGGDEVTDYTCWEGNAQVQAWARSIGINGDSTSVRKAFTERIQAVAASQGLRALFWEETFNGGYGAQAGSIITPWVTPSVAGQAVRAGHDTLVYVGYYLDQWRSPAETNGWYSATVDYAYMDSLLLHYTFDPVASTGVDQSNASHVLGAVASAWGDNNDSGLGATTMLYPRGLAAGEKFWSPSAFTNYTDPSDDGLDAMQARLEHARCKLVQRGIGAQPLGIAGDYGLCWRPQWGVAIPPPVSPSSPSDTLAVSTGGMAAIVLGAFSAGLALAAVFSACSSPTSDTASAGKMESAGEPARSSTTAASVPRPAASKTSSSGRVVALDQLRGLTMFCMLFVNLYYGRSGLPYFFSHGITYFSGPDLIEPAFHFCVGFALRLVLVKRLAAMKDKGASQGWWQDRWALFRPLFKTRVCGLIILSMFFTEGWGQFDSWAQVTGFRDWLTQLVQNNQPYHTLLHIALITCWTFLPMTMDWRARVGQLLATTAIHLTLHATFYFRWIAEYPPGQGLDEGGYFGFFGWAIEALVGSLVHDIVMAAHIKRSTKGKRAADDHGALLAEHRAIEEQDSGDEDDALQSAEEQRADMRVKITRVVQVAALCMTVAYFLSCLGTVAALNTVCYDGTQIYFWGGFGAQVPCAGVPALDGTRFLVYPPFMRPDPSTNVVTMWTMTQRAGSATYHLFAAGTSAAFFALLAGLCEMGMPLPKGVLQAGGRQAGWLGKVAGLHLRETGRLYLHWATLEVLGENALAVYLIGDSIGDNISAMLPEDCPVWYFIVWGEGLYIGVALLAALYLRSHKLFLRL